MGRTDMADQTLGQLARGIPGATRVFEAYHFDFCCAGNRTLRAAAANAQVDVRRVVDELAHLQQRPDAAAPDWDLVPVPELIEHIVSRYHAAHREQLPELIRLARRVEHVHAERAGCPFGLADHLDAMAQELESHMRKEESVLFPMMQKGMGAMASAPIAVMRAEHDDHGAALRQLAALTNDLHAPEGACTTWRALYTGLRGFRDDLIAHIHIENNILFERFAPAAVHA